MKRFVIIGMVAPQNPKDGKQSIGQTAAGIIFRNTAFAQLGKVSYGPRGGTDHLASPLVGDIAKFMITRLAEED